MYVCMHACTYVDAYLRFHELSVPCSPLALHAERVSNTHTCKGGRKTRITHGKGRERGRERETKGDRARERQREEERERARYG